MTGTSLPDLSDRLAPHQLEILGGFACKGTPGLPDWAETLLLIGPKEPGFWPHIRAKADWSQPNPIDHWSRRVIGRIACDLRGKALFPFGGPPWHPFFDWAIKSNRCWQSPIQLLVHDRQGLMVSFRGALALREKIDMPQGVNPCIGCARPCLTACPAGAFSPKGGYDFTACRAYLLPESDCMQAGCLARRACPVSKAYARLPEQSAYHMRQFPHEAPDPDPPCKIQLG